MVLSALRGAVGFLTTLPVGQTAANWEAFADRPAAMIGVGYILGALVALLLFLPLPETIVGFAFVLGYGVFGGINHADGLLDVADGVATHGDPAEARAAMKDSAIGVGAVLALGLLLLGLFAVGQTLAGTGLVGLVIAAEVGAKLGMVEVLIRGTPSHEGLGSALAGNVDRWTGPLAMAGALPAILLTVGHPAAAVAVIVGGTTGILGERWARSRLGGINGDVLGATNEVGRLAALLAGVIVWTLW
ncbi:adenosylcobinamide-GDP ribazoletransferase [Halodesulfurarchaeum sp. HSR-GB]|uniref:adenosylcobinamide-GDP ribazoletransferase n=1 Tax=Halodesulfurarchaeum sp. HSR-GB TaxID=3074077 RepID=UPI00285D3188|nr:adenosylcobinamide-GDP ribazoletransferase [Halodesulfurarchaeum sp. HSR-GB]MDR5656476.1 adenosylcobinamide-GDP ribazoletransferase [Halodesulfurarchaeum sp. HSR-GB]